MPEQGTHHFILTVQKPLPGGAGYAVADWSGWITPDQTWTRNDVFLWLKAEQARRKPELADGCVLFFVLERNQL
ncbi:hypothetical protein OG292_19770 [Streptomyces sp. NBC_01511]|uniref:hypothetical protein n=1 Tax=Streptomyces sp. NBC_01511 TaxID=2903889 RepID=UPI00386BD3DC